MNKMNFHDELAKLTPRLRDNDFGKIYVFGIGQQWTDIHQKYIDVVNTDITDYIFAFVDNDPTKQNTKHMGRSVISPSDIDTENAVVLISSNAHGRLIAQQLQRIGLVPSSSFFAPSFFDIILKRFVYAETARFSNSVNGGRCFIIGNGPSLLVEDLEVLHKHQEKCFAVNRIGELFNKTDWRPAYYFAHDRLAVPEAKELINMRIPKFFGLNLAKNDLFSNDTYYYDFDISPRYYSPYHAKFSKNIERMFKGGSIIYNAIQAAVVIGYNEIYLLGIDNKFGIEVAQNGNVTINEVQQHFYEGKVVVNCTYIDYLSQDFICAREYCESNNITIRNATRGGALEIFDRVDFDSLF